MIIVNCAGDADVFIVFNRHAFKLQGRKWVRGIFTVRGKIGDGLPIEMRLDSITAVKVYIEGLANIHGLETGYALKVFDMSERVYQ